MTVAHLLLVSLGPVQDFIAQARRTRDLWFGSHLLSELSRAVARELACRGAVLIFPALEKDDPELEGCDEPIRPGTTLPPLSVANKILAEAPAGVEPGDCARAGRIAAHERWRGVASTVQRKRGKVLADSIDDVWNEQIEEMLEYYAVWVPVGADYRGARRAAEQALAGRKNLRDEFRPWKYDRAGAPKSSLDGARVSVLPTNEHRTDWEFRRLGIRPGEQLDAIGLVKRTGFEPDRFIPLVNVAAGAWLERAQRTAGEALSAATEACRLKRIAAVNRDLRVVRPFPFDASALYPSRWPTVLGELKEAVDADAARSWGETHIRPLLKVMTGEPPSYVACLVADGDHMGRAIESLETADANRSFSRALAAFPQRARKIVEDDHCGVLIYAGGDDVLAFLPVAAAVSCAAALAVDFRSVLGSSVPAALTPTLSVGIGIGHILDAMASLLQLGRDAERAAKDAGRNALAVIVDKRSGGRRQFVQSWALDPLSRLRQDAALLRAGLSVGKVHAVELLLKRFPRPGTVNAEPLVAAFVAYANDLLLHTGETGAKLSLAEFCVMPEGDDYSELHGAVRGAIDRLLTVRLMREAGFDGDNT